MEIAITNLGTKKAFNVWTMMSATVNGKRYGIQMVRFDEPSIYGIRNGRISKLFMRTTDGSEVINYDRGWDQRPVTAESKALLKEITKKFN